MHRLERNALILELLSQELLAADGVMIFQGRELFLTPDSIRHFHELIELFGFLTTCLASWTRTVRSIILLSTPRMRWFCSAGGISLMVILLSLQNSLRATIKSCLVMISLPTSAAI